MYLLPWTLQEEIVRSANMSRENRLMKAVLSFKLFVHSFHLACLPKSFGISQRFNRTRRAAVTFAADATWPRLLNYSLILVQFVLDASADWSFSRHDTHCLENFFGLICRNSFGDDRPVRTVRIIAMGISVADVMHELRVSVTHRNRDNMGGVVISGSSPTFADGYADRVFRSLVRLASLEHRAVNPQNLLSHSEIQRQLQK
jgi:hypothetical protein